MIGRLTGILTEKQAPSLLLDVQGVGYNVQASMNTFFALPAIGETTTLHIHFVVREDAQLLFGFGSKEERQLFRDLIKVNGVGPKMALAILSGMSVTDFIRCVRSEDSATLTKLPGVGTKTASRLIVEMKDKVAKWESAALVNTESGSSSQSPINEAANTASNIDEAESALIALGYKPQEAARMLSRAQKGMDNSVITSENLIRAALKSVVKSK